MRRLGLALASTAVLLAPTPAVPTAQAGPTWCTLYCDMITAGCMVSISQIDVEACVNFHQGCLDGCEAGND